MLPLLKQLGTVKARVPDRDLPQRPAQIDQAVDLSRIIMIVYGLVLGQSLYQAAVTGGTHYLLNPAAVLTRTLTAAVAVVFAVTFWDLLGYTLNIRRFPYTVLWRIHGGDSNKTGHEELRFGVDLAVAIGYSQMLAAATVTIANPGQSLIAMFFIFFVVDALNLISEYLRWRTWQVPIRWVPYVLGGLLLLAYAASWHFAPSAVHRNLNVFFLWGAFAAVMARGILLRFVYKWSLG